MKKSLISQTVENSLKNQKILVGVSGGVDSMTLLFYLTKFMNEENLCVMHVNYNMRGKDNLLEQEIVTNFCQKNSIKCFVYDYDPNFIVNRNFQNDARDFRYLKAQKLLKDLNFDCFVSAHNLNDFLETYFIKKIQKRDKNNLTINETNYYHDMLVKRPFINVLKHDIIMHAKEHNIPYNDDYTNFSSKYLRNRIRKKISAIESLNPQILQNWKRKIKQRQNNLKQAKFDIFQTKIVELKTLEEDILEQSIYYSLNKHHIYKKAGFKNEVLKLIYAKQKFYKLQVSADKYLTKELDQIKLTKINLCENQSVTLNSAPMVINWAQKQVVLNFTQPQKFIVRNFQPGDKIFYKNQHKKLTTEFKRCNIAPWLRNQLVIIEVDNEIIFVENIFNKYQLDILIKT